MLQEKKTFIKHLLNVHFHKNSQNRMHKNRITRVLFLYFNLCVTSSIPSKKILFELQL